MLDIERNQLKELLSTVDCLEYLTNFEKFDITPNLIPSLDKESIKEMGVHKVGDRLRLQIMVEMKKMEKVKEVVPVHVLNTSINHAVNSIIKREEYLKKAVGKNVMIGVILEDGKQVKMDVNTNMRTGDEIRRRIISQIGGDRSKICYVDYNKMSEIHEIEDDDELIDVINNKEENGRLIVCKTKEDISVDAINTSNKIKRRGGKKEIQSFMGGRPPSQMISTNLKEYFPDIEDRELEDIKRKSIRMSMYSNRMSMLSMLSDVSYGVGVGVRVEAGEKAERIDEKIIDEYPGSVIELMDESDGEEEGGGGGGGGEEEDNMETELGDGPSVWHRGPKIGQGTFGDVYLGLNGSTGEIMAVKQVDMGGESKQRMVKALRQEVSLLKELRHENVVRYLGAGEDSSRMYIFLEYVAGGSVSSMLKMYGPFAEGLVRNFTRQVLVGVDYLHKQGIIHRDIKGGNILVDNLGGVKIGDFGISVKIQNTSTASGNASTTTTTSSATASGDQDKRCSLQGSVFWMAPEVVKQEAHTPAADIWSVGCLVVEMFTGKHPYPMLSPMQAIFQIGTGKARPCIPPQLQSVETDRFLQRALETDFAARASADELLQMRWVGGMRS